LDLAGTGARRLEINFWLKAKVSESLLVSF
jgi:hypothetical protein